MMRNPDQPKPPRAFISHASADKDRFVRLLDSALTDSGVRTFLDERDLLPGDKLIDRIFKEGISDSDVVIVVLSLNSIDRPWVKEELDAAIVQRIKGVVKKIIPVVLDDVTPPVPLQATVWEKVTDLSNVDRHFERIVTSIFGAREPALGPAPAYVEKPLAGLGMHPMDEHVLRLAGEIRLAQDRDPTISVYELWGRAHDLEILERDFADAISSLDRKGCFSDVYAEGGTIWPIALRLSSFGLETYLRGYRQGDYVRAERDVVAAIVNQEASSADDLVKITGLAPAIVEWAIEGLESRGYVRGVHGMGETLRFAVTGPLQRLLDEFQ